MRRYETVFILRPGQSEDEINTIIDNTKKIILDDNGSIISLSKWGLKKLAYTIKKENNGHAHPLAKSAEVHNNSFSSNPTTYTIV